MTTRLNSPLPGSVNTLTTPQCFHCGLPVPAGEPFAAELQGERRLFCCPSCQLVSETIINSGLGHYYQHATPAGVAVDAQVSAADFSYFDAADFQSRFVTVVEEQGQSFNGVELLVAGIHCSACVWLLEKYLSAMPGVRQVSVSLSEQLIYLQWQPSQLRLSEIAAAIAGLGYQPQAYTPDQLSETRKSESRQALRRLGVAGIGMMQVGMYAIALYAGALQGIDESTRQLLRWVSWLVATPVVLYAAAPFFVGAWRSLKTRTPGMDLPVAIAIGLAYLASVKATLSAGGEVYFDSVVMFTFFLLLGRFLEMRARHRGARFSSQLNSLLPATVIRVDRRQGDAEYQTVALSELKKGQQVLVKAGQAIPVDGLVVQGQSFVNEAQLTGEFMPQEKSPGDKVYAGTINEMDVLLIEVESTAANSRLQVINQLLHRARANKPRLAQLADRYASIFVLFVLGAAVATYIYWSLIAAANSGESSAFWVMLSVLVVSCPCALSLATPAALTAVTQSLRQQGLLVTNPEVWEKTAGITDVVCDKTGTLTEGKLEIRSVLPVSGLDSAQCMKIAAALEQHSEHPIACAFVSVSTAGLTISQPRIAVGQGVEALINKRRYRIGKASYAQAIFDQPLEMPAASGQWILLADDRGPVCWLQLEDRLRDSAWHLLSGLKQRGLTTHLLSGDQATTVEAFARRLKVDHWQAAASPEQKFAYIQQLQQRGRKVLLLGDGLNDMPVLATADISVAMPNASDLAKTQADAICLSPSLLVILQLLQRSARTRLIIRENLLWALAYNVGAIPLAAMGMIPPYLAALGMSLSSLVVIVNSLRLHGDSRQAVSYRQEVAGG